VAVGVGATTFGTAARDRHDGVASLRANRSDHVLGGDGAGADQAPSDE
jgi:hypothetical protein